MRRRICASGFVPVMRIGHPFAFAGFLGRIGATVYSVFRFARLPLLCELPDVYPRAQRALTLRRHVQARGRGPRLGGWPLGAGELHPPGSVQTYGSYADVRSGTRRLLCFSAREERTLSS